MALFISTVLGFSVVMGIVGYAILHFFGKGMNSKDSTTIDPKPFQ
ncbi:MAG: hypothetical protein ABWX58_03870 [Psychrobacillus psychrotolerans]|uniref:Uncharacterized protein n=1 Tax=Psychrobacillus psychrotolerans TaxID=126156 RepID=A0A1I6ANJ5_9BACI|nr:hypothetical protein [Psychrobacillus psychrotolerans]SFQ70253.1 hypothetical protein SAMN05421670_3515 [Psychrobacillus psychrotolerans]